MTNPKRILSAAGVSTVFKTLLLLGLSLAGSHLLAASTQWSAGGGANTNWSLAGNWSAGVPAAGDDIVFGNAGTAGPNAGISNAVDGGFTSAIGTLAFTNSALNATPTFHNMLISPGSTLTITNKTGPFGSALFVGTLTFAPVGGVLMGAVISGAGGTLSVSNPAANIVIDEVTNSSALATLNLTNLDNFTATASKIAIGSVQFGSSSASAGQGALFLAKTNTINLSWVGNYSSPYTVALTNAIDVGVGSPGNLGANFFYLGLTNGIFADSIGIGRVKAVALSTMAFNPVFTNLGPTAYFRGISGSGSRVTAWGIADTAVSGSSSAGCSGTVDFTGGTLDALVDTLIVARDRTSSGTAAVNGLFTFNAGTLNVNNLIVASQSATTVGNPTINGTFTVRGANANVFVNQTLEMGHTFLASGNGLITRSIVNITNGAIFANTLIVGTNSTTNIINIVNGKLVVTNTIATNGLGLLTLYLSNAVIGLPVSPLGNLGALTTVLTNNGPTNWIYPLSVPVYATYPKQVPLIKYTTLIGSGNNFGLTNLPAAAPGAFITNNTVSKSIDIYLPFDPRPVITAQPASYSGNPGDNVAFGVTISGNSVAPFTYQWYLGATPLADGATGNGSTLSGSATASLALNNAQAGDNGNYTVVISNAYGSVTSAPPTVLTISAGNIAPSITGPVNTTVVQGNNAGFTAAIAGNPAPALQWQRNGVDILGETGSSYTLINAQYPTDDGAVFSIIATNVAGSVTNSATLTVIVPPVISAQPVSLVVTSTQAASFSVTASGVPSPTVQWYFNNNPISGATSWTYSLASANATNAGTYKAIVSNAAGSAISSNATLTVNSTMSPTALSPANSATGICYDTPLAVTFSTAPTLGAIGIIKIYNVTNSTTPVDTISIVSGAVQQRNFPGDAQSFSYQTIQITGNTAKFFPHFNVLTSNATYYVTIDNGAFTDVTGAYFTGITATNAWQFATKVGGVVDATNPVVNADGSGDFLTVQGAINSLATGTNATQRVINIRNGLYPEIVDITGKHNITLRGQSRAGAVIAFPNNATFQSANGGTTHARMTFKVNANDIVLDTLTVSNSTPQGGSQAEALMIESNAKRCIVYNSELDSRQDTILGNQNSSQTYFYQSIVKGNFDYIWGGGNFYFDQCTIQTISGTGSGQLTAARTDTAPSQSANFPWLNPSGTYTANGMTFVGCTFTADPGLGAITLAGSNGTANNNVSWSGCDFATNYVAPSAGLFSGSYLFWQNSNTMTNAPVTFAVLTTIGVTNNDPRLLAATNIPTWFYGWSPQLVPNILTNPASQTVNYAAPATFTVVATGIPAPTYQWQHAGTNLPSATGASLTIGSATLADAGNYAVTVTTPAGSATSLTATLTVNPPPNTAPTFTAPITGTNFTLNVGVNLAVNCPATDSDSPAQTLTYTLLSGPSGAAVNPGSGNFTWRPTVAQSGSMNSVQVVVTDNGTPNLSATNNFTVTITPLTTPTTDAENYSGGVFSATISGQIGPDYALQANTNLAGGTWTTVATTNSPATMPVTLTDPNAGSQPVQFYRIVTGPPLP